MWLLKNVNIINNPSEVPCNSGSDTIFFSSLYMGSTSSKNRNKSASNAAQFYRLSI